VLFVYMCVCVNAEAEKKGSRMDRDENVFTSCRGYDEVASGRAAPGFGEFYFQSVGFRVLKR
jgi:hypothetical protein